MNRLDNQVITEQLNWRYACKKFDPAKKIREPDWNVLLETLRLTASSYGLQPWKFLVIQNPDVRKQLLPLSWGQTPVTEASHFVVLTYKEKMDITHIEKYLELTAQVRSPDPASLERTKKTMINDLVSGPRAQEIQAWAQRQTYIAMGSFLTVAALMQIDTLPMEGLDPAGYDKVLNLENTGYKTVAAIAAGYRSIDDQSQFAKKIRFAAKDIIENR